MKGSELRLIEFMNGSNKRFIIPVYQRNYDWKTENCKQLYNDLIKVIRNKRKSHFFGSIVSVYNPSGRYTEHLIIDGQQRLTTVSLLLLAMYNLIKEGKAKSKTDYLCQQIYEDFLVDKYQPKETRMKLKPVKNDQKAFGKLFDEQDEHIRESNITINYNYFYNRIQLEEISMEELFDAICSLEIINIVLNNEDNPQLIFESLNSTGVALSEGDKIRNFILMGLNTKEQEEYYEKYWNRIEEYTNYQVSLFIRDYLSVKRQETPSLNKIYVTFKEYVEEKNISIEELLKEILKYSKLYNILISAKIDNKTVKGCIYRMNRLETTVTRSFLLEVLKIHNENNITDKDLSEIFQITENYIFRRTICDLPSNQLNKIFLLLHKEIMRYDNKIDNYLDKFKYALTSKKDRARFPEDIEFTEAFENKQVYLMNSKNKIYLLERIENYGTAEDKDIYRHIDDGDYSIEHIMPQHLTPAWIKELGNDYEDIHETWLHRIANLTLTAYNSKYSNNTFIEKRDMKNGFKDSGIRMNQQIANKDHWGLSELQNRSYDLSKKALEIWFKPKTDYKPMQKQMDAFTLDDDTDLSGRKLAMFSYKNVETSVTSWIEMFEKVIKMIYDEDKSEILKLITGDNNNSELSAYISADKSKLRGYLEIDNDVYIETNTSTSSKISILKKFFGLYNIELTDLIFYVRDEDDSQIKNLRYDTRMKYWDFAIPYLKQENEETGIFNSAKATNHNWLGYTTRISGIYISCVANYDSARVELYIGKPSKEQNKKIFDYIYTHKNEIEQKLDVKLEWLRGDDMKASKITYTLNDIGIEDKANWTRIAKFQAEWSKKFYDIITPYIKII